jgi:drug/metabolite transporter, DME family
MFKKYWNLGPALVVTAAVLWALDGIIRRSLYVLPPITIVFFEHLIGFLIIAPFFIPKLKKEKWTGKEKLAMVCIALFSSLLGTLWFTTALLQVNYISFSVVFLLQKLQPIFAISAATIILHEKVDRRYIKWAVLALVAAYFVTFKNGVVDFNTGSGTAMAALYAFGAAFVWGASTALSRYVLLTKPSEVVTGLRFALTVPMALIAVYILGAWGSLGQLNLSELARFILLALSTGMVALYIYYRGLKRTQAKITTLLELVFPTLAIFIDATLYHTLLAPTQYLAALVLLFAIYRLSLLQKPSAKIQD